MMENREPFDHSNPHDIVCDHFRVQVTKMVLNADRITLYRELSGHEQISCFMAGVLTGLLTVCFAAIRPEGRDRIVKEIVDVLPIVREQAEGIMQNTRVEQT